jgi:hypothetical protein
MLESNKKEIQLSLNAFNSPTEASGPKAWIKLITQLLFLVKGTYPSDPNMGIGIQQYEFSLFTDIQDDLEESITEQIRTYLPDIPFDSVTTRMSPTNPDVLLIFLNFTYNDSSEVAVVATQNTNNGINFAVQL